MSCRRPRAEGTNNSVMRVKVGCMWRSEEGQYDLTIQQAELWPHTCSGHKSAKTLRMNPKAQSLPSLDRPERSELLIWGWAIYVLHQSHVPLSQNTQNWTSVCSMAGKALCVLGTKGMGRSFKALQTAESSPLSTAGLYCWTH